MIMIFLFEASEIRVHLQDLLEEDEQVCCHSFFFIVAIPASIINIFTQIIYHSLSDDSKHFKDKFGVDLVLSAT